MSRVLRRRAVQDKTGLRHSAIYQRIKAGTFPKPIYLGPKAVGWLESEIDAWIDALASNREANRERGQEPRWQDRASNNTEAR